MAVKRFGVGVLVFVLLLVIGAGLWSWITLSWAYSEGERAGTLQKFSKKGWFCKTYEGELALYVVGGIAPQIWYFSTRDDKLAVELSKAVGQNVQLHYEEHVGVPTNCFAETPFYATGFTIMQKGANSP